MEKTGLLKQYLFFPGNKVVYLQNIIGISKTMPAIFGKHIF